MHTGSGGERKKAGDRGVPSSSAGGKHHPRSLDDTSSRQSTERQPCHLYVFTHAAKPAHSYSPSLEFMRGHHHHSRTWAMWRWKASLSPSRALRNTATSITSRARVRSRAASGPSPPIGGRESNVVIRIFSWVSEDCLATVPPTHDVCARPNTKVAFWKGGDKGARAGDGIRRRR